MMEVRSGYHIEELLEVIGKLEAELPQFEVMLDWSDREITSTLGTFPAVDYQIKWEGKLVGENSEPIAVIVAHEEIGQAIRTKLVGHPDLLKLEPFIKLIECCSMRWTPPS